MAGSFIFLHQFFNFSDCGMTFQEAFLQVETYEQSRVAYERVGGVFVLHKCRTGTMHATGFCKCCMQKCCMQKSCMQLKLMKFGRIKI
jgi:hypothetical protein